MYRVTILCRMSEDPAAFQKYCREVHIPIARRMKGLTGRNLSSIDLSDGPSPKYQLVAEFYA